MRSQEESRARRKSPGMPFLYRLSYILAVASVSGAIIASLFYPSMHVPATGLAFLGAVAASILASRKADRFKAAYERAWTENADARSARQAVGTRYRELRRLQENISGEVVDSVLGASGISGETRKMQARVDVFHEEFSGAAAAVSSIDSQLDIFSESVGLLASVTEESATVVEEISASIERISAESGARYEDANGLLTLARESRKAMATTRAVIVQITDGITDLRGFIEAIDNIAARTSILSMNAAVQAARAGSAGKGFAVVADEIRKLADAATANSINISKRLGELIQGISKAQEASAIASDILDTTERRVGRAADSFLEIMNGTRELTRGGREILDAVAALRQNSILLKDSVLTVVDASGDLDGRIVRLREKSETIRDEVRSIRDRAAEANGRTFLIAQSNIAQLKTGEGIACAAECTSTAVLILQHISWISRIRAVLDGKAEIPAESLADHTRCDLGKWFVEYGRKTISDPANYKTFATTHERVHALVREIVRLHECGEDVKAEILFDELKPVVDSMVDLIKRFVTG